MINFSIIFNLFYSNKEMKCKYHILIIILNQKTYICPNLVGKKGFI